MCCVLGMGYMRLRKAREEAESRQEISKWIAGRGSDIMIALEMKDKRGMVWSEANPAQSRLSMIRDSVKGLNPSNAVPVTPVIAATPYGASKTEGVNPLNALIADDDDPFADVQTNPLPPGRRSLVSGRPMDLGDNSNSSVV